MSKWSVAVILAIAGIAIAKYWFHERDYSKYLEEAKGPHYYGKGSLKQDELAIHSFTIKVEDEVLVDLKNRLKNARITHVPLTDANDFWYGFNSHYLKEVRDYWLNKYDWKKQEKLLNTFKHYKTQIEGLQIHFIRAHPPAKKYKQVFPILLAHGWPGNVFEFYKIIPILSDPKAHGVDTDIAFEVVAPSIPGYGWSEAAHKRGLSQLATARIFTKLMHRLQHKQFYIQGGDWGSMITALMSKVYPESILGLHLNTVFATASEPYIFVYDFLASIFPKVFLSSPALQKSHSALSKLGTMFIESGYMHLQATRPDTVGTGLNDSPIGLAAYILEKFSVWTNTEHRNLPDGGLTKKYTLDELLTLVMIYWTNGNIANSQRYYREFFTDENLRVLMERYVPTPTAHASGMNEFFDKTPVEITRHLFNLTHYTELADVGHFAAFEEPEKLAKDIFSFVHSLQKK